MYRATILLFALLILSPCTLMFIKGGKVNEKGTTYDNNYNLCNSNTGINNNVLSTNITFPHNDKYQQQLLKKSPTASTTGKSNDAPRPHIIMALFDDLGANDLGIFSGGTQTPRTPFMDTMMRDGIKLKQYYVQPICSPTRSALMTGRYPIRTGGQHGVAQQNDATWIPDDEIILAKRLSQVGYTCKGTGKWHLGHGAYKYTPTARGFKEFFGGYQGAQDHWEHIQWTGGGPHRDSIRRSQHVGASNNGVGAASLLRRPKTNIIDHKYMKKNDDGTIRYEHITTDNMTHSTDTFTREAVRMVYEHNVEKDGQLFLYLPYTAPHWPTQFYQQDADINSHIPGKKRREFAGMITQIDRSIQQIVEVFQRKGMWSNTLFICSGDNGGDITTGASNWPYRGTKTSPWEGGTRVASFVYSQNPAIVPPTKRGSESHALAHVTDWYPTLLSMAGVKKDDIPVPGKPLDGVDVWENIVSGDYRGENGPRKEMLYALDDVVTDLARQLKGAPNMFVQVAVLRIGDWKLIEGYPGRGDWYGEDPSLAWPVDYIMGKDVTDYNAISRSKGGKVGDGGQFEYLSGRSRGDVSDFKRRWLFNLKDDPTEQHDLQFEHPEKVEMLLKRIEQLRSEQVPPFAQSNMNYFKSRDRAAPIPQGYFVLQTESGNEAVSLDIWSHDGLPAGSKLMLDGEVVSSAVSLAAAREARKKAQAKL